MSKTIERYNKRFRIKIWELNDGTQLQLVLDREFWPEPEIWWEVEGKNKYGQSVVDVIDRETVKEYFKILKGENL